MSKKDGFFLYIEFLQRLIITSRFALVVFLTLISINGPLIIINTRFARKIDVKLMFN